MTTDLAEYRQADLDPYNECRMMDAERRKNEKANEKDYSTFDGSGTGGSGTESGGQLSFRVNISIWQAVMRRLCTAKQIMAFIW